MRLNGQNFRILILDSSDPNSPAFKCIGMSQSCSINLNANSEESSTKDDVSGAAKPEVTSNTWSVSVESLNVADAGALLTAMKSMTKFTLMWDETSTTDNQTGETAAYQRIGDAYLNDLTLTFDDRTNSVKSMQFTGTGKIERDSTAPYATIAAGSYTKGQFVRLFLSNAANPALVVASAKSLSLHVSLSLEEATTKDTTGTWAVQEPTGISYDISGDALVASNETINSQVGAQSYESMQEFFENITLLYWQIANVSGNNNRTKGSIIVSGQARLTSLQTTAANRQAAQYSYSLAGYGDYTVGS